MWHYTNSEGAQHGPVDLSELQQLYSAGLITEVSHLWKDGMDAWLPATSLPGVLDKLKEAAKVAHLDKQQFYTHESDKSADRAGPFTLSDLADQWTEGVLTEAHYIWSCLLYTSDAADEEDSVDLGGRRNIKKKNNER
eukprot:TRINITY_DN33560_c0_g1_i1.p1 TRINITY_DN33560_c0_g1~~TRINITY_DN33560_c0_g1_i1.p1  ORF type:complete len:138 (-),score=38.42 TRINITY_DN33560_c0_g1_i1:50-463(-)